MEAYLINLLAIIKTLPSQMRFGRGSANPVILLNRMFLLKHHIHKKKCKNNDFTSYKIGNELFDF